MILDLSYAQYPQVEAVNGRIEMLFSIVDQLPSVRVNKNLKNYHICFVVLNLRPAQNKHNFISMK